MTDLICELGRRRLPSLPELYFGIVITGLTSAATAAPQRQR